MKLGRLLIAAVVLAGLGGALWWSNREEKVKAEKGSDTAPKVLALKEEGILCKETHDRVIRIAPPLIIKCEEIDWAFERIKKVIENQ